MKLVLGITAFVVLGLVIAILALKRWIESEPCEEPLPSGEVCTGRMYIKRRPIGPQRSMADCLVCNTCGHVEPLVPVPTRT